uniref:Uncharacterized protein n=1 Tax=Rhizophora mucronata TaxID=61149 RepID=A0A2P2NVV6_RHIMU
MQVVNQLPNKVVLSFFLMMLYFDDSKRQLGFYENMMNSDFFPLLSCS